MIFHTTRKPGFYLRLDRDAGWVLKVWRLVVSFNVIRGRHD